jgi:hypothetical protein
MAIKPGNSPIKQKAWRTLSKGKTYGKYLDEIMRCGGPNIMKALWKIRSLPSVLH